MAATVRACSSLLSRSRAGTAWQPKRVRCFSRAPVVVGERADRGVPQYSRYSGLARRRACPHLLGTCRVRGDFACFRDRQLRLVQQAVEIGRNEIGRVDRAERLAVRQPARAEVPAAFGRGSQIAVDVGDRPARVARRRDIFAIGFLAWRVAIVPVAIEQRAVAQSHDAAMRGARRERVPAFHPELIFAAAAEAGTCDTRRRRRAARPAPPSVRRRAAASG